MNNILITGAAGFLGSKYTNFFSKKYNVFALDINLKKLYRRGVTLGHLC